MKRLRYKLKNIASNEFINTIRNDLWDMEENWSNDFNDSDDTMQKKSISKYISFPNEPLYYSNAVALQMMTKDTRLLEMEAAALGYGLVSASHIRNFDFLQPRFIKNNRYILSFFKQGKI